MQYSGNDPIRRVVDVTEVHTHVHTHDDRGLTVGDVNIGGASKKVLDKELGPLPADKKDEPEQEIPVHLL